MLLFESRDDCWHSISIPTIILLKMKFLFETVVFDVL